MIKIFLESDKFSHIAGVTLHETNILACKSHLHYIDSIAFILYYHFIYYVFTEFILSFTISTLQLDSSHILPSKLSSACNYYTDDSKQNKIGNNSRHDNSVLGVIDPDNHFWNNMNHAMTSEYYNEMSFNNTFSDNQNLLHLNIRSVRLHFTECLSYL